MRNKIARTLLALAVTLPLTLLSAEAQWGNASNDEDIATYSQELDYRIEQGRGSISDAQYQSLRNMYNRVDMIRRQLGSRKMNPTERNNMMASLMNLDKELTNNLHDPQNARYQDWDPGRGTWKKNWWSNVGQNYNYNDEIETYQQQLKQRMDRGRSQGKLTPAEYNQLLASYNNFDRLQRDYKRGGYSFSERNALMNQLTQLDRDVTANLRDNDKSRYDQWDPNKKSWNQKWWRSSDNSNNNNNDWKYRGGRRHRNDQN